ncbi:hypothetical protein [Amycolatopsis jejuensis]|uniref:hypothetical protein n=1 Tax=Amycolatopsis jejuensis TaxID=330084 RepID=UPI0005242DB2|nr:hypothetical protein [Amycolatopsis jejuensis]
MSDTTPTWGYVVVTGLAGFAGGLLVAALLVAGSAPRPAGQSSPPPSPTPAQPVTVTVTGLPPPPITVTHREPAPPPRTTTATVSVTPAPSTPESGPPTSLSPTLGFYPGAER